MATKDRSELYKGHWLRCTPFPAPGGRFAPYLVIEGRKGIKPISIPVDVPGPESYATEDEAVAAARARGQKWVDDER